MYVVSIGIRGEDHSKYTAIYFADPEFLVNRISYPTTFSDKNSPQGTYSIQAEITFSPSSNVKDYSDEKIIEHVISGLKDRALINGEIILTDLKRVKESYVVYDVGYEEHAKLIRDFFSSIGINLLGRFSYFEYINVDMAVKRSLDEAIKSNKKNFERNKLFEHAISKLR
jgi:protoporphyrinogen oxidase